LQLLQRRIYGALPLKSMFEHLRLLKPGETGIVLQTRLGHNIKNAIDIDPDETHVRRFQGLVHKFGWNERKPATGGYNCVGHIWACRRTGVFDDVEDQLNLIFKDDGYRVIDPAKESLVPGDLATYWRPAYPRPTFLHVGMIVEMRQGLTPQSPRIPWVLSKIDSTSGEVFHGVQNIEFIKGVNHLVIYWTDRPR
jgi:hypothetical protein